MLRGYRRLADGAPDRKPVDQARVVLTGSFCEQPPLGLIKTLERAGCYIVDDDFVQVHRFLRRDVPLGRRPARRTWCVAFLDDAIASPTRYIDRGEKGADLVERVREARRRGRALLRAELLRPGAARPADGGQGARSGEGIPWTAFKYAENNGQFQVIREQAGTFADSIKLWSEA